MKNEAGMSEDFPELDEFVKLQLRQLEVGKMSTLLVLARDKSTQILARKLKPEFGRVFISSEAKDCIKLLCKHTNDAQDVITIDLVLTEFDPVNTKLVDHLLKRPNLPETHNCPIIPVMLLTTPNNQNEANESAAKSTGALKTISQSSHAKDVLLSLIEMLYNSRKVEDLFKDLKQSKVVAAKYPYLPIFNNKIPMSMKKKVTLDTESVFSSSTASSAEFGVEEIEDSAEYSSMLPEIFHHLTKNTTKNNNTEMQLKIEELAPSNKANSLHVSTKSPKDKKKQTVESELDPQHSMIDSNAAHCNSQTFAQSIQSDLHFDDHSSGNMSSRPSRPVSEQLLDSSCRPVWNGVTKEKFGVRKKPSTFNMKYDLSSFVSKAPPQLLRPVTVGGLDKLKSEIYWREINGSGVEDMYKKERPSTTPNQEFHPTITVVTTPGSDGRAHRRANFIAKSPSHAAVAAKARNTPGSPHQSPHHSRPSSAINRNASLTGENKGLLNKISHTIEKLQFINEDETNDSHRKQSLRPLSASCSSINLISKSRRLSSFAVSITSSHSWNLDHDILKEEQRLAGLAKQNAPDYRISNLLDIDFAHRKINLGEKDMLLRGQSLERSGDTQAAISCYTRAGAHSKDQQISRMLLGSLHYRAGRLVTALKFYSVAITILDNKLTGMRLHQDEFLAYYNRSIINFRLGADETGWQDLEKAVLINPKHLQARELLSLVKRRMGKYHEAISDAMICKAHREVEEQEVAQVAQRRLEVLQQQNDLQEVDSAANSVTGSEQGGGEGYKRERRDTVLSVQSSSGNNSGNGHQRLSHVHFKDKDHHGHHAHHLHSQNIVKGIQVEVLEPACHSSLRDKIVQGHLGLKDSDSSSAGVDISAEGGFLKTFKINNGCKMELFEDIFVKPSDLQASLLIPPHFRLPNQIEIITDTLKLFPYTRPMTFSSIQELSNVIEFRALHHKDRIFGQNEEAGAVCMLLSGVIQTRLETSTTNRSLMDVSLGELPPFTTFGYIDLLFRHPRPALTKMMEDVLVSYFLQHREVSNKSTHMNGSDDGENEGNNNNNPAADDHAGYYYHQSLDPFTSPSKASPTTPQHFKGGDSKRQIGMADDASSIGSDGGAQAAAANSAELNEELACQSKLIAEYQALWATDDPKRPQQVARCVSSGMFMNYLMNTPCEFLMVGEQDFDRLLYDNALAELKARLSAILSSGIFRDWKMEDIIRLARMGQIRTFKRGETILRQGIKPDFLYIVMKGLCKVKKRPHRTEILLQQLNATKKAAEQHDLKYVFHHKLEKGNLGRKLNALLPSTTVSSGTTSSTTTNNHPTNLKAAISAAKAARFLGSRRGKKQKKGFATLEQMKDFPTFVALGATQLTDAEIRRQELSAEINRLEVLIRKAHAEDAREQQQRMFHTTVVTVNQKGVKQRLDDSKPADLAFNLGNQLAEIGTLQWPMIFGESCVLDPQHGVSRGMIVADTACDIFMIHKVQIQTFLVDDIFLERVKGKAVSFPTDADVVVDMFRQQEWEVYRKEVVDEMHLKMWSPKVQQAQVFT